jgi:hypothetical protein
VRFRAHLALIVSRALVVARSNQFGMHVCSARSGGCSAAAGMLTRCLRDPVRGQAPPAGVCAT